MTIPTLVSTDLRPWGKILVRQVLPLSVIAIATSNRVTVVHCRPQTEFSVS